MKPPRKKPALAQAKAATQPRRSKLAKENDISAETESEIKEAWALHKLVDVEGFEDEKEGVIPTGKIAAVMRALGIAPRSNSELQELCSILDPEDDGFVTYPHFLELAAIQINSKSDEAKDEEVEKAFKLFTKGTHNPIRVQDLRRVATTIKETVSDDVLKAMILEANGGSGISQGVDLQQFREIMVRAGVFS